MHAPDPPDHYATLGIPAAATPTQITHAYRVLARALHPDTATVPGDTLARFTAVAAAYAVLGNPGRRAAYDQSRHSEPSQPPQDRPVPPRRARSVMDITLLDDPLAHSDPREPPLRAGPTRVSPLPQQDP